MKEHIVIVGKYKFKISETLNVYEDRILSRNMKIGGVYPDCVNISIGYKNNEPVSAYIPILNYHPECSLESSLDRGKGSIIMIKTLLKYLKTNIPSIKYVSFEDCSTIECANKTEIEKAIPKYGKKVMPISLNYFSIAFNGLTWYEKHFNAKYLDETKYKKYREQVDTFLESELPEFNDFLDITGINSDIVPEIKPIYESSTTYKEFFRNMPVESRCRFVRTWLIKYMTSMVSLFDEKNWIIPLDSIVGGNKRKNKTRKNRYILPRGNIRLNKYDYHNIGVSVEHI